MNTPENLYYTKSHEWLEELTDGRCRIGLTDFAQEALGDLVFVNLPQVGDALVTGEALGDVESVKAVSDIFSPVTGVVTAVNEALLDAPEEINRNAYEAWLVEAGNITDREETMDAAAYEAHCAEEE